MNQTPPPQRTGQTPANAPVHHSIWERILDDLHKRPGRYLNAVLVLVLVVLAAVLLIKVLRGRHDEAAATLATAWNDAWNPDVPPKARAGIIDGLAPQITDDAGKALRLYDLAVSQRDIAEAADTQAEKLAAYEKVLAYCSELKSKYPNSLWAKLPIRPPTTAGAASLSPIDQAEDYAKHQIEWLKAHPYPGAVEPDPNLSVTFELEDGRKIVVGKLFGRVAPYHVQNFVELARSGYFDGTAFSRVAQGYKRGVTQKPGEHPPNISIEGGHPFTKLTPDNREDDDASVDIGYSVPDEANNLPVKRGSLVAEMDPSSGGDSPSRFKIYADEPPGSQETVFAEVTDGMDVVESIVTPPSPEGHPSWSKDLVRIRKATVQGSVLKPPERPFPPPAILPEPPKPVSRPTDSRPESRPESRGESRPGSRDESRPETQSESRPGSGGPETKPK
jgi:cyclophilin family peptidyl-prolyl cis-trans isomerase